MKQKKKEKPEEQKKAEPVPNESVVFEQLLDTLLNKKDELFEATFLTEEDKLLLDELPEEKRECVRNALLIKNLTGKYQRVSADYANFQKRAPKQLADNLTYEKEKIIKPLLSVLDNFDHTLQNAGTAENGQAFIKGVQIIYDQMLDALKSQGVEQINARGRKFDPALHQAMMQKADPDAKEDIVLEEFQKGYKLNGRVIRPSKVIVNKLAKEQKAPQAQPAKQQETTDTE